MKQKFYWIHKDYSNPSLNYISQRLVEFYTAELIQIYDVEYVYDNKGFENFSEVGRIFLDKDYTVQDLHVLNSIMNYNVYFKVNTEPDIELKEDIPLLDCFVSMASGIVKNKKLLDLNRYIIDISPRALEFTKEFLSIPESNFFQLDVFDKEQVKNFLSTVEGQVGLIYISNCFLYIPNCILYDINLRIKKQNEFLEVLKNDKVKWYVNMVSANGETFYNVDANSIPKIVLDERFKVLPWIT
jgi:hypothetical protein